MALRYLERTASNNSASTIVMRSCNSCLLVHNISFLVDFFFKLFSCRAGVAAGAGGVPEGGHPVGAH